MRVEGTPFEVMQGVTGWYVGIRRPIPIWGWGDRIVTVSGPHRTEKIAVSAALARARQDELAAANLQ